MLIGLVRPRETHTVNVTGPTLEDVHTQLAAQQPEGFALTSAPARMLRESMSIEAKGTFERRDGIREIEAEDMDGMHAKVPEGWQLLSVRRA